MPAITTLRQGFPRLPSVGKNGEVDDQVDGHEIAERLGVVKPQVVHDWRHQRANLSVQIVTLKTASIRDWHEAERRAKNTNRIKIRDK